MRRSRMAAVVVLAGMTMVAGCADGPTPMLEVEDGQPQLTSSDGLARSLAVVLGDRDNRVRLFEAMDKSGDDRFYVSLAQFLESTEGTPITAQLSALSGLTPEAVLQTVRDMDPAVGLPSGMHRAFWTPDVPLQVGAQIGLEAGQDMVAFSSDGKESRIGYTQPLSPDVALLTLVEAAEFQPAGPFRMRLSSARLPDGPALAPECGDNAPARAAGEDLGPQRSGVECCGSGYCVGGVPLAQTLGPPVIPSSGCSPANYQTYGSGDADHDGYKDACEAELASLFEPRLQFHSGETCLDRAPVYAMEWDPFTHEPSIIYMLSYRDDCGYNGVGGHHGDSEFIIVRLWGNVTQGSFRIVDMVTSAHWSTWGDQTKDHWGNRLTYVYGYPKVWAAKLKHANYSIKNDCSNAFGDSCNNSGFLDTVHIGPLVNVGNVVYKFDIDPGVSGSPDCKRYSALSPVECYFTKNTFDGWYTRSDGVTGYWTVLQAYGLY